MRVAFYNPVGVVGGGEMNLLDVLASLRASRPSWDLRVVIGDDGPLRDAVAALGVGCDVVPLPSLAQGLGDAALGSAHGARRAAAALALAARGPAAALGVFGYVKTLRRHLAALAPDLLQTNGMKAHVLGTWAAPKGLPVVWHLQDFAGSRPVMARLLRLVARGRAGVRVVAITHAVAEDVIRVVGRSVRVDTIYSAVDLDRFSPGPGGGLGLDERAGFSPAPEGTVRVGLVATYARWKGHDVFLDAVSRLPADLSARYYVVGGPLYRSAGSQFSREELQARAEALGVSGRVGFVGHTGAPEEAFRALDVVVHASTRPEPFGRVIVEAMASGRAVVVARDGGAAELFEDGVSALGCTPGDPAALAAALARLVGDATLRRALGEGGRLAAAERFDRDRLADAWAKVYEEAAGRPRVTELEAEAETRA